MKRQPSNFSRRAAASLSATAVAVAVAAGAAGCDGTDTGHPTVSTFHATVPASFVRHRSRGGRVALKTPASWREISTTGAVVMYLRTDQKTSSVNLVTVAAAPGETLDKTMAGLPALLRHEFADFTPIKAEYLFLKDLPAGRLVYEASRGGFHGKMMLVVITRGGTHYFLTYTAEPDRYDSEAPVVEQVIASLEIE